MENNTEVVRIGMNILIYSIIEIVKIYLLVRIYKNLKNIKK